MQCRKASQAVTRANQARSLSNSHILTSRSTDTLIGTCGYAVGTFPIGAASTLAGIRFHQHVLAKAK